MNIIRRAITSAIAITILSFSACQTTSTADFNFEDVYPWCIVAFDSMERSPQQRIQLLHDLGFEKYAYDSLLILAQK